MKIAFNACRIVTIYLCSACLFTLVGQSTPKNIPPDLVQQLITDISDNENDFRLSSQHLRHLKKYLKFESKDLNGDAVLEFFLSIEHSDWCGAGSNCTSWVYQKRNGAYRLLLEARVLRVKDTVTNGFSDLASMTPMGFCSSNVQRMDVSFYQYDGKTYKLFSRKDECIPVKRRE